MELTYLECAGTHVRGGYRHLMLASLPPSQSAGFAKLFVFVKLQTSDLYRANFLPHLEKKRLEARD